MRNIGAWLIIVFGAFLTFAGAGEDGVTVGAPQTCPLPSVGIVLTCPTGHISVVKTISGTAPQSNWLITVGSSNCSAALVGRNDLVMSIPPTGGTASVLGLEVYTDTSNTTMCQYTLTETPVSAWTPGYTPPGPYTLSADATLTVALLNTADPTTTTAAPTTTIAATTTTAAEATTTVAPTVAPTTTANGSGAGAPATVALPATGSSSTNTQTVLGIGLMIVGASLLVLRRRAERTEPTVG